MKLQCFFSKLHVLKLGSQVIEALLEFHFTTHCQIHQEGRDGASNFIDGPFKIINLRIIFFWGKELLKLYRWRLENIFPQDTFLPLPSPPKENKANKYGQAVTLGGQTSCLFSTFLFPSFTEYKNETPPTGR